MTVLTIVRVLWSISAIGSIILVLLHSPKGDGLGGLGGQAQLFTSTKSAETTLNRLTWTLVVSFIAFTIVLSSGLISPQADISSLFKVAPPDTVEIVEPATVDSASESVPASSDAVPETLDAPASLEAPANPT
jgi:preprotein translocase subunit SecG